ncbi:TPA: NAD-dependent epimerase/dehydratase family protein [Candidatus Poribacteria bacterium]|nr:NAD-dependent epimerase/dehydratase family protein [Candidatus Poribacteria bacterium]
MKNHLVIGGAGFIGCNLAAHLLKKGDNVTVFDNLSRRGALNNIRWLIKNNSTGLDIIQGDISTDNYRLLEAVRKAEVVYHLASQTAVTTSVINPREDFEINALGTLNVLEAIRGAGNNPVAIYSSTNKVYGKMEDVKVRELDRRYEYQDKIGISEEQPLDFHSPYGNSKGAADQYFRDYARIYGLRTVVFRQSCIYGPHQFGIEDQGWVAYFTIQNELQRPITIYGDGKQVRDVLFVGDLIRAFELATQKIDVAQGQIYNIGGGPQNTLSLLELVDLLENMTDKKMQYTFSDWRPGDQRVYISDIRKAKKDLGWNPKVRIPEGLKILHSWVKENREILLRTILKGNIVATTFSCLSLGGTEARRYLNM